MKQTFSQRWRQDLTDYQQAHRNPLNQLLHYFAFLFAALAWLTLFWDWRLTLVLAVLHYVFSWIGHFVFEKNQPASFRRPLLGFYAGFSWFFLRTLELITGKRFLP
ncbi:DUF962 domain-containing protein [Brevibacillus dissolubilis]|uniref:DUF962 domain-containing protein n=1 Tax=Brevibacillus dissolubilis TaxID=1844116 RepID=UPI0021003708|nr:DUF962 domain-containing protein [Brevibacillus dissolubilis]